MLKDRPEENLSSYDYELPERLIAQKPVSPRDSSRLLVVHRQSGKFEHRHFRDLPDYLDSQDQVVANNTKVLKARLLGHRIRREGQQKVLGGKVEFVLLEELAPCVWEGLFHASAKYLPGLEFEFSTPDGQGLHGVLTRGSGESPSGTVVAQFNRDPVESGAGELPLPHYIRRNSRRNPGSSDLAGLDDLANSAHLTNLSHLKNSDSNNDDDDVLNYQTIYGKAMGSAAAPTAGLHFTPNVLEALKAKAIRWEEVTLHVGLGTFRPVKTENIRDHVMHEERYEIAPSVASAVNDWKHRGNRIVAVGTTTVRTLESAWGPIHSGNAEADADPEKNIDGLKSGPGRTSIFIRPGGRPFQVVDRLITNFHLPKSTLLMLVSAFAGRELILEAYREAVHQEYRFFSYGDAMFIL